MNRRARCILVALLALMLVVPALALAAPEGQITYAIHFSLAPTLFEPAETPGVVSPFMILYALHDALVKPMPGKSMAPSLAESWSLSSDGLLYEFVLRKGPRFHTGEPVTADDVKFSFERYRGISAKMLKDKVAAV
jgi:peptide/nickel transport system substrate-binding protein